MIAVSLFPEMKMKDAGPPVVTVMTSAVFAALEPQLQTEAVLIMADAGYGIGAIERLTGQDRETLKAIASRRHQVKAFQGERVASDPAPQRRRKDEPASATGRLVLGHMASQAGVLASSMPSLAYDLGVSESAVTKAIRRLAKDALIERVSGSSGQDSRVSIYRLTRAGEVVSGFAEICDAEASADA